MHAVGTEVSIYIRIDIDMVEGGKKFARFHRYEKWKAYKEFSVQVHPQRKKTYDLHETGARRLGRERNPLTPRGDEVESFYDKHKN